MGPQMSLLLMTMGTGKGVRKEPRCLLSITDRRRARRWEGKMDGQDKDIFWQMRLLFFKKKEKWLR